MKDLSARAAPPHPALRAPLSHKGRGKPFPPNPARCHGSTTSAAAQAKKKARRNRRASSLGRKRPGRAEAAAPPHGIVYRVRRKIGQVEKCSSIPIFLRGIEATLYATRVTQGRRKIVHKF
ncbi:hypothetical protein B7G68_18545 [Caulobacter segnis]|uniref:Uncharacterized protein n=1 Tax=Caulobacter segnis TaxID=88688 RepID=A0ABM6TK97_9CAUL|nr:hypothetical protein B7G68_18545 [Caulobacter segnis]